MPIRAIHVGWFTLKNAARTEDKSKNTDNKELNTTKKKQTMQNTAKQKYRGLVAFYDTRSGIKAEPSSAFKKWSGHVVQKGSRKRMFGYLPREKFGFSKFLDPMLLHLERVLGLQNM